MTIETASLPLAADPTTSLLNKAEPNAQQAKQAVDDLMTAFEAFKQANDERLAELETRSSSDVVLEEKVDRINARVSELNALAQRPVLAATSSDKDSETKAAFEAYIRQGDMGLDTKAALFASTEDSNDGKVFVPEQFERRLNTAIGLLSPLARLAGHSFVSNSRDPSVISHASEVGANWVSEVGARPVTDTPKIETKVVTMGELYANPTVTQRFFDDADMDVEGWLLQSMVHAFADKENAAFVSGDGQNKPTGLLSEPYTHGQATSSKATYVKTGKSGGFTTNNPTDKLLDAMFKVPGQYRANAAWLMNANSQSRVRKLRDPLGNYIWTPSAVIDQPANLFGHPVYDEPNMPDFSSNSVPIVFGDFERAYLIARRPQTQLIRDPYSQKPLIQFYATRHVGGRVVDTMAFVGVQAST